MSTDDWKADVRKKIRAGFAIALLAIFLCTLADMAHAHRAIPCGFDPLVSWILIILEWPVLLLDRPLLHSGYMFYHSHVQGSDFWKSLWLYFFTNGSGWSVLFVILIALWRKLLKLLKYSQNHPSRG